MKPSIHRAGFFIERAWTAGHRPTGGTLLRFGMGVFELLFLVPLLLAAQSPDQNVRGREIGSVEITIDGEFTSSQIASEMITQPTPWGPLIFLHENISSSFGAPRRFFDPLIFYNDISHLYDYFYDLGYFRAVIDTAMQMTDDGEKVEIALDIKIGERSIIDSITMGGLSSVDSSVLATILDGRLIKIGDPFVKQKIFAEQNRILQILHSNGYPRAVLDSVSIRRYASSNNISFFMRFSPEQRFLVGPLTIRNQGEEIDEDIIVRQLDFAEGDVYSEQKRVTSEQNLNRLGIFENATVRPEFVLDSAGNSVSNTTITFRTLEFQEVTPEFLVLSENNELFSTGLGLGYKHRNFFGGARNFSVTARGRINRLEELNFPRVFDNGLSEPTLFSKADVQSQLVFPYFYSNKTTASITLTAEAEKQPDYRLNTLRAKISFTTKFATYTNGITDFNIERVDPRFTVPQNVRPEDSTKQFNFIEAFTLQRNITNNIFSPTRGFLHSATIEEAGLISKSVGGFQLPYSEYVKISFLIKHFFSSDDNQTQVFAFKLQGGIAQQYNKSNTTPVPLPRRFFVGGSGSVRAWKDKQLAAFGNEIIGGNMALEGSIESRTQLFPNKGTFFFLNLENVWSVIFLDYGNTWYRTTDVKLGDVAAAVGFGLRYETFVGPFRFDVAWRLYDPKGANGRQWLYEQSFFTKSFAVVHFGIGHAF